MYRYLVFVIVPVLVGFAPVPPVRPMTDPDRDIQHFEGMACSASLDRKEAVASRKRRLLEQLRALHERLLQAGDPEAAESVRERLLLAESVDRDRPLGEVSPAELLRKAAREGKYRGLQHVIYSPSDQGVYSQFQDYGYWNGSMYGTLRDLQPGYWVYVAPRWFIWKEGPPRQP